VSGLFARSWGRLAAVVAIAAVAGLGTWWFAVRDRVGTQTAQLGSSSADMSERSLRALSDAVGRPVYWAGPQSGVTYEFTETADRRIYVRYLPLGVAAGSPHPYLTVASYPVVKAFAVTSAAAGRPGMVKLPVSGGVGFYANARPTNAYIAYPGSDTQIELYDPSGVALRQLVAAGRIQLVGSSAAALPGPQIRPTRTSDSALLTLSAKLDEPIYWLGALPGRTLELTRAPYGRIDLRYLPRNVAPGSPRAFLAVGTYPLAHAFQTTVAASKAAGTVSIPLPNGAVAFYAKTRPTNVYVAFPGVNEQIEVYDPSARVARRLIAADKLVPVP
jgi:hypothetical protein